MTTITAEVLADSIHFNDPWERPSRLTTLQLRYPRFIHAEFMTHRQFSRNSSSSRAIPVSKLIADALDDPAVPLFWGKNQKGMQATEECDAQVEFEDTGYLEIDGGTIKMSLDRRDAWLYARDQAITLARAFSDAGYHKQVVNRLLEPFTHINVVVTATEWANFFALRQHEAAEPHIRVLADKIRDAMSASTPRQLKYGEWHLPYVELLAGRVVKWVPHRSLKDLPRDLQASVARCARTSYLTHDGLSPTLMSDVELYGRLVGSQPAHASPAEHQATPDEWGVGIYGDGRWNHKDAHGNLKGWVQFRKLLPHENVPGGLVPATNQAAQA